MTGFWASILGREPEREPGPADPDPGPGSTAGRPADRPEGPAELAERLTGLVRQANEAGARMPEGAVVAVGEIADQLRPLLTYLARNPAGEQQMIQVRALLTDYLPTTLNTYLALPAQFAAEHHNRRGVTPAQELVEQLVLLIEATRESATAIYSGDAQALTNQGQFLRDRFARSELDL